MPESTPAAAAVARLVAAGEAGEDRRSRAVVPGAFAEEAAVWAARFDSRDGKDTPAFPLERATRIATVITILAVSRKEPK